MPLIETAYLHRALLPGAVRPLRPEWEGGLVDGFISLGGNGGWRLNGQPHPTIAGGTPQGSIFGPMSKFSGSSSGAQLTSVPYNGSARAEVTAILDVVSQSGEMLWEQGADIDSHIGFYLFGTDASNVRVAMRGAAGGTARFRDINYVFPTRPAVITVSMDVSVTPYLVRLIADGVLIVDATTSVVGTAGAGAFINNTLNIGSRNGASLFANYAIGALFVHGYWHDVGAIAALHADLTQIFALQTVPQWFGDVEAAANASPLIRSGLLRSVLTDGRLVA